MSPIVNAINAYYNYKGLAKTFDEMADTHFRDNDLLGARELVKKSVQQAEFAEDMKQWILKEFKEELEE